MQTLNDVLGIQPTQRSAAGELVPMDLYAPQDVEDIFSPPRDQYRDPRQPTQVEFADASGSVPLPARASQNRDAPADVPPMPDRGERSPAMQQGPLVQQGDSRYVDTTNVIVADTILGGLLPWIQAAADLATGRVPVERYDEARMEHEKRIESLKAGHPELVGAAEKAMPFLSGLGLGIMKPARTAVGTVGRGMAVGGAEGAVQGFTGSDPEMGSLDPGRISNVVSEGAQGAILGGAGAALPEAAKEGKAMLGRRAARIEREDAAAAASEKKRLASEKAKQTKLNKARVKERAEIERAREEQLIDRFKSYRDVTGEPAKNWKRNRDLLNQYPEDIFKQQAAANGTLDDFSRRVNLPPVAILQKLRGRELKLETPQERSLYKQLEEVEESWQAVRRRGMKSETKDAPAASTNTGPEGTPTPTAAKPAAGGRKPAGATGGRSKSSRSKPAPAPERRPGDEPIRVPRKPQRSDER